MLQGASGSIRTIAAATALVGLLALPTLNRPPVQIEPRPAATPAWLTEFNSWRANVGVPILTENSTWSTGDYDHALYMVKNDLVTHYETPGTPYYTTDGDTAARNSNIYVSSSTSTTDDQAIDWWMRAPFHAMGMMDPRLTSTGFGSYREVKSGWNMGAAVDVLRGNSFSGGSFPVFFPGNGTSEPFTTFAGNEWPDPLQACPGYSVPTGLPVFVELGGNVATTVGSNHSFTGNGVALDNCVLDSNSPGVGSNLTYRGGVVVIPRQPLQTGVKYAVSLTVNGSPYAWSFTVGSLTNALSCTSVSATTAPASPLQAGRPVTITATSTNCPNPRYRFWVSPPGQGWTIVQDYSASNTFVWTSTAIGGTYRLEVDARDSTSYASYDLVTNFTYTITTGVCGLPALISPSSPTPTGGTATFTASASGCPAPNYRFWVGQSGIWKILQDYSASATFNWNTTGYAPGAYGIEVDVRDASSSAVYDHVANLTYSLVGCGVAHLTTNLASPQSPGASVVLSGSATCPGTPEYRFWVGQNGAWTIVQDYSPTNTFTWNTAGKIQSTYGLEVDVRDHGSGATYEAVSNLTFALALAPCTAAQLATDKPSPQVHGTTIVLTGGATCPGTPEYRFWVRDLSGRWTIVRDYSSSNTFSWSTTGLPAGTYGLEVDVRNQSATVVYETVSNITYTLS